MLGGDSIEAETEAAACSSLIAHDFFSFVDTCKYILMAPWWYRSPMSSADGSCKAQELRSSEWSEIMLCMNAHVLPSHVKESCFVIILLNPR